VILADFQEYLPLEDIAQIVVVCLIAAVVAPAAIALSVSGLGRNERPSGAGGTIRVVAGIAVLVGLIAVGLFALVTG
jgi:hypothetical protein